MSLGDRPGPNHTAPKGDETSTGAVAAFGLRMNVL